MYNTMQIGQLQAGHLGGLRSQHSDPSADKDQLKAENPKITAKPRLGLIESFIRYHGNCKYWTPPSLLKRNPTLQNNRKIQGFQRTQ